MIFKYVNFPIIFCFSIMLLSYSQLSYSSSQSDLRLEKNEIKQSVITFKIFDKEFIFTNSAEDYHSSFKRLIDKYNIRIPEEILQEILLPLTQTEKDFVKVTVSNLVYEANQFSYYKNNDYYITLNKILKKQNKLNLAAAIEIALVNDYKKKVSKPSHIMKLSSNTTRYLYLINHARYELVSAILYDVNKIN